MKQLIIIGARGFGREVYSLAKNSVGYNSEFVVKGFLDDQSNVLNDFKGYPQILGSVEDYEIKENDIFVCALGSVKWKKHFTNLILQKSGIFCNLIHTSVSINENVVLGTGNIICEQVILSNDMQLGSHVTIHPFTNFGHDVVLGDNIQIGAHCFIGGYVTVKNDVTIYVRATLLDRINIAIGSTVGAASLVIKDVKENTTVFGIPAKSLNF